MYPDTRTRQPEVAFGPFVFNPSSRLMRRDGVEIPLPPRVIGVLELLLARAGDVIPRQELIDTVWKDAFVTDTSLAEAVSFLRQALGDDPQAPTYIQTVHRRGYRFLPVVTPDVREPAAAPSAPSPAAFPAVTGPPSSEIIAWSVAILSLLGALSAGWYATRQRPVVVPVVQLPIAAGAGLAFDTRAPAVAVSGALVAWSACGDRCDLYVRSLDSLVVRRLEGTEGAAAPFLSPDGRWVGFFADGKLKKVLLQGGAPVVLSDAPQPFGAAWLRDGHIVFAASVTGGLMRVREQGGEAERLTQPSVRDGELRHVFPSATPSGDAIVFVAVTSALPSAEGRLVLLPYGNSRPMSTWRTLAENVRIGAPVGDEFVTYLKGRDMFAQAYDSIRQASYGPEQIVTQSVAAPQIAVSPDGALAFIPRMRRDADAQGARWTWSDRSGETSAAPALRDASLSPDGTQVAGISDDSGAQLWTASLARGTTRRLTYGAPAASPVWSVDGARVFYASQRPHYEIWVRDTSASSDERQLLASAQRHLFPSSASAGQLAFVETGGPAGADVGIYDFASGARRLIASTRFDELAPAISPDGSMVAYQTDESGGWEVVVLDVRSGKRVPISTAGGTRPLWTRDGGSLLFESGGAVMRVAMDGTSSTGAATIVHRLVAERAVGISPSGSLLLQREYDMSVGAATVTLQWIRELRKLFGPPPTALPR